MLRLLIVLCFTLAASASWAVPPLEPPGHAVSARAQAGETPANDFPPPACANAKVAEKNPNCAITAVVEFASPEAFNAAVLPCALDGTCDALVVIDGQ